MPAIRFLLTLAAVLAAAGCGRTPATTVHGRPIGYWFERLHGSDAPARRQAVKTLSSAATADPAVLPALTRALSDDDAAVRGEAVLALLKVGPAARQAVPALEKCREDADPQVRGYAEKALARIRGS
jgi:HEAT repeat protein